MPLFLPVHCLEFAFNSLSCKQVTVPAHTHERGLEQKTVRQEMENHQVPSQGLLATSVILQHFLSLIFPGLNPFEKVSSVQLLSCVWLFATPWTAARQASLSITNSQSLFKLMSIESVKPSNHLILCHPLQHLPSIFPSIRIFPHKSAVHVR